MTNEQLVVLLRQYYFALMDAIDRAREAVPDDAPRQVHRIFTVSGQFTTITDGVTGQRRDLVEGRDYYDKPGEYLCLMPFVEMVSRITEDIERLTPATET
jgi:hypothetical protein